MELSSLFDQIDINQDGTLSVVEFVQGVMQIRGPARARRLFELHCDFSRHAHTFETQISSVVTMLTTQAELIARQTSTITKQEALLAEHGQLLKGINDSMQSVASYVCVPGCTDRKFESDCSALRLPPTRADTSTSGSAFIEHKVAKRAPNDACITSSAAANSAAQVCTSVFTSAPSSVSPASASQGDAIQLGTGTSPTTKLQEGCYNKLCGNCSEIGLGSSNSKAHIVDTVQQESVFHSVLPGTPLQRSEHRKRTQSNNELDVAPDYGNFRGWVPRVDTASTVDANTEVQQEVAQELETDMKSNAQVLFGVVPEELN